MHLPDAIAANSFATANFGRRIPQNMPKVRNATRTFGRSLPGRAGLDSVSSRGCPMRNFTAATAGLLLLAIAFTANGCEQSASPGTGSKHQNAQTPPVVVLDGTDLNLGSDMTSASSECREHPGGNFSDLARVIQWRGVTTGQQPNQVMLFFTNDETVPFGLFLSLSNGKHYETRTAGDLKVEGPTNDGWYQFSGSVTRERNYKNPEDDNLSPNQKPLSVRGSIACANYGAPLLPPP